MYTLTVGNNDYKINGAEAAWYAYQTACALIEAVGGDTIRLWTIHNNKIIIIAENPKI